MKVILWATLTANGNYARSDANHAPIPESLADFGEQLQKTKNFIVGRRTFEGFQASGAKLSSDIDVVVVTKEPIQVPGITSVTSPLKALEYLQAKGYEATLIAGGETMHNAFLAEDLVDELVFNVAPVVEDAGLNIILTSGQYKKLKLLESKNIGGDVIQLHYSFIK